MVSLDFSFAIQKLLKTDFVTRAFELFERDAARITAEQIKICSIAAPPFGEAQRAEYLREKFVELGYANARIDREGNCLALFEGRDQHPLLVVSAHLDTVFPENTDVQPRIEGSKIFQPGIMDDGCGLVAVLALAEVAKKFEIKTEGSILFVGTVGEEAAGNLRGVRHLMSDGEYARLISAFISLDGAGVTQIVHRALGSKRYLVRLNGVGGHSWLDFGAPNPIHALSRAIAKLTAFPLSPKYKTTFNIGRIEGGASVNAIPTESTIEVDLRSENDNELLRLDAFFRRALFEAVDEENDQRHQKYPALELDLQVTGERPGGETSENSSLVRLAIEATTAVGHAAQLTISSTDANLPMSLEIPAITIGAGGSGDKMHTVDEWYDSHERELGLQRALLLMLAIVGVRD